MRPSLTLTGLLWHVAAISFLGAATAALAQSGPAASPLWLASESVPAGLLPTGSSSSSSDSLAAAGSDSHPDLTSAALAAFQPPPRRYGRPNFSDKTSNPDGSAKYTFLGGIGVPLPVGDTHIYETPSYGYQFGAGRNFDKNFGVLLQFDYDHFGLQAATLNNQTYVYGILLGCTQSQIAAGSCVTGLDGNNHVWSFTLNPTFTLAAPGPWDAYAVVGGGFYHKVTNFTQPTTQEACSIYGCGYFTVSSNIDHYTSNAFGLNGGLGVTLKLSRFSNLRLYLEARYVLVLDQQRAGVTPANAASAPASATNFYPANSNRTTYIPIKLGFRF